MIHLGADLGRRACQFFMVLVLAASSTLPASGAIQFDVFLGYDGWIRENAWFPVACEIHNDGPPFDGVVEIRPGSSSEQAHRVPIELPTNTRKRFVVPIFSTGARFSQWHLRLLDSGGKVRADSQTIPHKSLLWEGMLIGALGRTFAGAPELPPGKGRSAVHPQVVRLQPEFFPETPLPLEGLDIIYLNTERALDLSALHGAALAAWVRQGGRLVVCIEQSGDLGSLGWLQEMLPFAPNSLVQLDIGNALVTWIQQNSVAASAKSSRLLRLAGGAGFSYPALTSGPLEGTMPVWTGTLLPGGLTVFGVDNTPLCVEAPQGRGWVTVLTFNPEREPFRSWPARSWFWAKMTGAPPAAFENTPLEAYTGWSIDGVFGALLDSRQGRKLPVEWLLLLLAVYLVVIGPLDQWWLKRINRQMLTWITFPAYVALFSLLIYYIGYRLRAGDTEWNEVHIVDVVPVAGHAELRGQSYASLYASKNARFPLASDQPAAALRSEYQDSFGGSSAASPSTVSQAGNAFTAEVFVPVWTSALYVHSWWRPGPLPIEARVERSGQQWRLEIHNLLDHELAHAQFVVDGKIFDLGTLPPNATNSFTLDSAAGGNLRNNVSYLTSSFQQRVQQRRNPLGDDQAGRIDDLMGVGLAATFPAYLDSRQGTSNQRGLTFPNGMDWTPAVERGDALLLAWELNRNPVPSMRRFQAPRVEENTLLRLHIPIADP